MGAKVMAGEECEADRCTSLMASARVIFTSPITSIPYAEQQHTPSHPTREYNKSRQALNTSFHRTPLPVALLSVCELTFSVMTMGFL